MIKYAATWCFRGAATGIILYMLSTLAYIKGYNRGHFEGYTEGMADLILENVDPVEYMLDLINYNGPGRVKKHDRK